MFRLLVKTAAAAADHIPCRKPESQPQVSTRGYKEIKDNLDHPQSQSQSQIQAIKLQPEEIPVVDIVPVSSPRIRLSDGRYIAYTENGVPKEKAKFKIVIIHGFGSSKEMNFIVPQDLMEELGIYMVLFDRAGYGESNPNAKRTVKSEALDIQEVADELKLGSKFYVVGVSLGSYPTWSCLRYIPERLAGVAFVVPVINYRWRSLPKSLTKEDYRRKLVHLALWFSKHAPRLLQWWVTQKWLPSSPALQNNPFFFNEHDVEVLKKTPGFSMLTKEKLREREAFDTLRHDFIAGFDDWEFDPLDLSNPFTDNEGSVHIWQGYQDKVVPYQLQRFVSGKLPWIKYHEVPEGGHLIVHYDGICEAIIRALLLGEESPLYIPKTNVSIP